MDIGKDDDLVEDEILSLLNISPNPDVPCFLRTDGAGWAAVMPALAAATDA